MRCVNGAAFLLGTPWAFHCISRRPRMGWRPADVSSQDSTAQKGGDRFKNGLRDSKEPALPQDRLCDTASSYRAGSEGLPSHLRSAMGEGACSRLTRERLQRSFPLQARRGYFL